MLQSSSDYFLHGEHRGVIRQSHGVLWMTREPVEFPLCWSSSVKEIPSGGRVRRGRPRWKDSAGPPAVISLLMINPTTDLQFSRIRIITQRAAHPAEGYLEGAK